jgi:hypothetical protein
VEWSLRDELKLAFGGNFKGGSNSGAEWDDCRACNPFPPFTAPFDEAGLASAFQAYSRGLGGIEPLGRFRAGPIGTAIREDEVFLTLRYQF